MDGWKILSLLSIGLNSSTKNHFLGKFCFRYGKCHNSIVILKLILLKNQINSESFKYCKERREGDWAEKKEHTSFYWQPIRSLDFNMEDWTFRYCYLPSQSATFLPWRWVHVWLVILLVLTLLYTLRKINCTSELIRVKLI